VPILRPLVGVEAIMNFPAPLLGLAIGDALGMPFETAPRSRPDLLDWDGRSFRNSDDYHGLNPGQWTDDTQMSLALSRTLIEHQQYVPEAAALAYRQWFEGDCRGIGGSTKRAMEKLCRGVPWTESGTPGAEGNGTAMRAAPFWFASNSPAVQTQRVRTMTPLQQQYLELNTKWQLTRELEGYIELEHGTMRLSDEREIEFAVPLSDIWDQMTDKEQDELEAALLPDWEARRKPPEAPEDLGLVDTVPQSGQMPRRPV